MKETRRIYENGRGTADNIAVFGNVTIVVASISVEKQQVMLTLNPNITGYQESKSRQSIAFEPTFRPCTLTPGIPATIPVEGKNYKICPISFGTVTERGRAWDYCDIEVEEIP